MKQFLLCIFILFLVPLCSAQENRVVKDNINCTYGIKNRDGKWIVEPNYILIEQYNTGYFLVRDIEGLGVFSPSGKQIIACKYKSLSPINRTWYIKRLNQFVQVSEVEPYVFFLGTEDTSKCIINSVGQKIGSFPLKAKIEFDGDEHILVRDRTNGRSSYLDTTGNISIDNLSGQLQPFGQRSYSLIGDYPQGINSARGNVRLIDQSGELLINQAMDHALIDTSSRIFYVINGKYGVMMISGDTIISPKFKRKDGVLRLDRKAVWVIYDEKDRAGIMKNDGTVILEPMYDQISSVIGGNRSQIAWMIENEGYFGILNFDGKEIIPTNFDHVYPVHFVSNNQRELLTNYIGRKNNQSFYLDVNRRIINSDAYDSILPISDYNYSYSHSITNGLITKRDGKYGILNPDGSKQTEFVYDRLLQNPTVNQYFFCRGKDIIEYNFSVNRITSTDWLPYASDELLHIYTNKINYLSVIKSSKDSSIIHFNPNYSYFYQQGNFIKGQHLDSKKWVFFNMNSKKKLPLENIIACNSRRRKQFLITTSSNHHGIIDVDGNLIIDTVYSSINLNKRSSMIWATKIIGNRFVFELLDSIGRKVLPNMFDNSFELDTGDQIASQNQKKGVIDSKSLAWKIRPEHFCLLKLFGDYYYAGNEVDKKGILHADGRVIVPLIYDTIILLYTNCHINGNCLDNVQPEVLWLLRKGETEFLADQDGKLINSKSAIRTFKSTLLFDDDSLFETSNLYPSYPALDYSPSLHFLRGLTMKQIRDKRKALWTSSILKNTVFDTINKSWETQYSNCHQGNMWIITAPKNKTEPIPILEQARQSCDCLKSSRFYQTGTPLIYQLRSIGAKFVTIDISYKNQNNDWDHLRGQGPPAIPNNQHINIIENNGKAQFISLKDIFPDNDVLMQEFITSLKKRDDLVLDCSSLENMLDMIEGNFSLSSRGIHLYLNQNNNYSNSSVELIIPTDNLANHSESKWIVPIIKK